MCITKTQIHFSPTENILFLFFPSIIWIILITSFCCKCAVFKTCWLKQMLLGMVKELITDQKCLLSFAKVFIDSPSSTKWGGRGVCVRMGGRLQFASSSLTPLSDLSFQSWSLLFSSTWLRWKTSAPCHKKGGTKEHLLHLPSSSHACGDH